MWVDRPVIYPVNYIVDGEFIVFRTLREGELYTATFEASAALEIDGTDAIYHEGWSVLVVGRAYHVHDPLEIDRLSGTRLTAWAGAKRDCFVKIALEEVTGRHIHHRVTPDNWRQLNRWEPRPMMTLATPCATSLVSTISPDIGPPTVPPPLPSRTGLAEIDDVLGSSVARRQAFAQRQAEARAARQQFEHAAHRSRPHRYSAGV